MIGQLQNKFRTFLITATLCAAMISTSAFAETVAGRIIYSDWYVLVKDEGGVQTVMARGEPWPTGPRPVMVQFTIDEKAAGNNNLYIIAGSRPSDGLEPFLAFSLTSQKALQSGESAIEVFKSDYADINAPTNPVMIKEIIEGGMGGGTFGPSSPLIFGTAEKSLGTSTVPGIWAEGQEDNGRAVVFRLPYSALISSAPPPPPPAGTSDEREAMLNHINLLEGNLILANDTNRDLTAELSKKTKAAETILELLKTRDAEILAAKEKNDDTAPDKENPEPPFPWIPAIGGGIALLGLGGFLGLLLGRNRPAVNKNTRHLMPKIPRKISRDNIEKGMVFAPSQMMVGSGSLPLSLAAIQPVYDAVGRIGFAQDGKPVGKDELFGTGILVSDRHILTNRHVWEMFNHRLTNDEPTGIEFHGEKNSDKSDFVTFADDAPIFIEGWDAAILTLSRPPESRKPVTITSRPAEQLNDLDIVVVGYPQAHRMTEDIVEVTEEDAIFGVKRYSEGKVFRHSADTDATYGVEAFVEPYVNATEYMPAICHNASTLGGSSGSAVICKQSGDLIALHFGFDSAYEWEEAANFAVAGENLAESVAKITDANTTGFVTPITDKPIR